MKLNFFNKLLVLMLFLLGSIGAKAQCSSLANWLYVAPVTVSNTSNAALGAASGYFQVEVDLTNPQALVTAGKMQSGGADIVFTDQSCNPLYYWIQKGTFGTGHCVIWVKLTSALAASQSQTINMYYGLPTAQTNTMASYSSGANTFDLFDDFSNPSGSGLAKTPNTSIWNINKPSSVTMSVTSGVFKMTNTTNGGAVASVTSKNTFNAAVTFEADVTATTDANSGASGIGVFNNSGNQGYTLSYSKSGAGMSFGTAASSSNSWSNTAVVTPNSTPGTVTGTWGIAWPAQSTEVASWGGTFGGNVNGYFIPGNNGPTISTQVGVAMGILVSGGTSTQSISYDWVRVRQFVAVTPGVKVGKERSNLLTIATITGSPFCVGASTSVSFAATGTFQSDNVFQAFISDSSGSFANPTRIGQAIRTSSGIISVNLPSGVYGNHFSVEVISTDPVDTSLTSPATTIIAQYPGNDAGANQSICFGKSAIIGAAANAGNTYAWTSSDNSFTSSSANPTVSPSATTTYALTETNFAGCASTNSVKVTVNPLPTPSAGSNQTILQGSSVTLGGASNGDTYSWSDGTNNLGSTSSITVSPSATTTYTVTETNSNNCTASAQVTVTVTPLTVSVSGSPLSVCLGGTAALSATAPAGASFQWYNLLGAISGATSATYSATASGTYYVVVSNGTATATSSTLVVVVNPLPGATVINNTAICAGQSIKIGGNATLGSSYSWTSNPSGFTSTSSNPSVTPSSTTTYYVTEHGLLGCDGTNSVTITVNPLPAATAGTSTTINGGQSVTLGTTAVSGDSYSWSDGTNVVSTSANPTFTPSATTTYTLTETNTTTGCTNSNTVTVSVVYPAIAVQGNGNNIAAGATSVSATNNTNFGTTSNGTETETFTILDNGAAPLNISSLSIGGANASDFTVTTSPASSVAANGSTTFVVTFNAATAGTYNGTVTINSNDPNTAAYTYAVQATAVYPAINVQGNGNNIAAGATTVSTTNGTNFGTTSNGTETETFTVQNNGSAALRISSLSIGGANASDFTVTTSPAPTVAVNGSTTFVVTFNSATAGTYNGTVTINSNDPNTAAYTYAVQATAVYPAINVQGNGNNITAGSTSVATTNGTNFGTTSNGTETETFTVQNNGGAALNISSLSIGGANASDFTVTTSPASSVSANGSTTFVVTFNSATAGTYNGTVTINSNDPNTAAYTYAVQATAVYPAIAVQGNGNNITAGSTSVATTNGTNFGTTSNGTETETFTVQNNGGAALNISSLSIGGANASDFTVTTSPASTVAANGSTTFVVTFNSATAGTYNGTVTINSNDPNTAAYTYAVQATAVYPAIVVQGNGNNITTGSTSVSTTNATNFGTTSNGTETETFTILNNGGAALNISSVKISGANASDFTVTSSPASSVSANGSTTFVVTFNSATAGTFNGTVCIKSNDPNTATYTYAVQATAVYPAIAVQGNGNSIAAGSTSVSTTNNTNFGTTGTGTETETFTILNNGGAALNISSLSIGGANASDFTVSTSPASTVAANGSTTFVVTFNAATAGTYNGTVTINSNDPNTAAYTYAVQATEAAPAINVQGNGNNIAAGSTSVSTTNNTNFGTTSTGTASETYTIQNTGGAALSVSSAKIGGGNASNFTVTTSPASSVAASGSTTFVVGFSASQAGVYNATVTVNSNDPKTAAYTYAIQATNKLNVSVTPNGPTTFCNGGNVVLSASSNAPAAIATYQWYNGSNAISGATSATYTASASGNYSVTVNGGSQSQSSNSTAVTVNPVPVASFTAPAAQCYNAAGNSFSFKDASTIATGSITGWAWTFGDSKAGSSASQNPTYTYTDGAGIYTATLTVTSNNGCASSKTVGTVTINALPTPVAGSNQTILQGSSATIGGTANGSDTYSWSDGSKTVATTSSVTVTPSATTTYTVTETNSKGCSSTAKVTVTVTPLNPGITANGNTSFCDGDSVQLVSNTGTSYQWSDANGAITGATSQSFYADYASTFYCTISNGNASATSKGVAVTVNQIPAANAGDATSVCAGGAATIGAAAVTGDSYSWTSSPSGFSSSKSSVSVAPSASTTYTLTEISAAGCSNYNSVTVNVNPLPTVDAGVDQTILNGTSTTIGNNNPDPNATYSWTSSPSGFSSSSSNPTVAPSVTTTYTVTETNANGCSASDQIVVTVTPVSASATSGSSNAFCPGGSVTLTATTNAPAVQWYNASGAMTDSINNTITVSAAGSYYFVATNGTVSQKSNVTTVTVYSLPTVNAGSDKSTCDGSSVSVGTTAVSGVTYAWSSIPAGYSATSAMPTVTPSVNTTYIVTATSANGCTANDTAVVTVNALPLANTGTAQTINSGSSTSIGATAVNGDSYAWTSNPSGFTSTSANPTVTPSATTTYTLTETTPAGCKTSNSVTVTVTASTTKPTVCITGQTTFCAGGSVKLTSSTAYSYQWYNGSTAISGATSQVYYATTSGTYTVTVVAKKGGSSATSNGVTVTVIAAPAANAGSNQSICAGSSASIGAAAVKGDSYSWTTGSGYGCGGSSRFSTSSQLTVTPSSTTTYTLTETNANGCTASNTVTITVVAKPCVSLASYANICAGASAFTLTGGSPAGGSYTVDGKSATTFNPATSGVGTHTVVYTYTNATGCSATASKTITVSPAVAQPTISYTGSLTICSGSSVKLTANESGNYGCGSNISYTWSNQNGPLLGCGYSTQSITVSTSGTYYVTVSVNGCGNTSKGVAITVNAAPTVSCSDVNYNYGYDNCPTVSASCNQSNCSYSWSCGNKTQSCTVSPTQTTKYYCTASNNGCTAQASCTVYVNDCHDYNYCDKNHSNECAMCYYNSSKKAWCQTYVNKCDVATYQKNGYKFSSCGSGTSLDGSAGDEINIYPNPFSASTNIRLSFVQDEKVTIDVISMDGRTIKTIYNGDVTSGSPYNFTFDGSEYKSGVYMVRVISGQNMMVRKIELLKN